MKRRMPCLMSVLLVAALLTGCSSLKYVKKARTSFSEAKAAGAENDAPFEYYSAEAYLELADHEIEEGDNPQARIFADESEKYSAEALDITGGGTR